MKNNVLNFPPQAHIAEEWITALGACALRIEKLPVEIIIAAHFTKNGMSISGRDAIYNITKLLLSKLHEIDTAGI